MPGDPADEISRVCLEVRDDPRSAARSQVLPVNRRSHGAVLRGFDPSSTVGAVEVDSAQFVMLTSVGAQHTARKYVNASVYSQ